MPRPRAVFPDVARLAGPARTAAIAQWFQGLFPDSEKPVLVGGAAVELYTAGAYTSGDLDFVGQMSRSAAAATRAAGFSQQGRHLVRAQGEVYIELPSASLRAGEQAVEVQFGRSSITVVSPEDLVIDRLLAWRFWSSEIDGVQALELMLRQPGIDRDRLRQRAIAGDVEDALALLLDFLDRLGEARPSRRSIEEWLGGAPW